MTVQRTTQVSFMGRVGYVSGFDTGHDAAVMLVQETLLACYARVAIQKDKDMKDIVLRGAEIKEGKFSFGRHFILLPEEGKHDLFKVEFVGHSTEGSLGRTSVKTNIASYPMHLASAGTVVDTVGTHDIKLGEIEVKVDAPGNDLYYIDIRNSPSGTTPVWKNDSFHMFLVRSTVEETASAASQTKKKVTWRYVAFFNRVASIDASMSAINLYMRHLIVGNLAVDKQNPIKQHIFDQRTGTMEANGVVIAPRDIKADETSNKLTALPAGSELEDFPIVPSVVFVRGRACVMTPWAHPYAGLLFKYMRAIRDSVVFDANTQIGRIVTTRRPPDYTLAIGTGGEDLLIFTTMMTHRFNQQRTSIAVKDSNIARILFGSSVEWARARSDAKAGVIISSPGFGCLDYVVCDSTNDRLSTSSLWEGLMLEQNRNGELNEMLGLTSEELDQILFPDSPFFRSFIGRSAPYADAVAHWMREMGMHDNIKEMRGKVQKAYKEALEPYIRNVIASVKESLRREETSSAKNNLGYLIMLQEGHKITGYKRGKDSPSEDTTKLLYEVDITKYVCSRDDDSFKRADGGIFLYWMKDPAVLSAESAISNFVLNTGISNVLEAEAAIKSINYSLRCPYGYVAHIFHKILRFSGNHLDFFSLCKVIGNPLYGSVIDPPKNVNRSVITNNNGNLSATNVHYFTTKRDDPLKEGEYRESIKSLTILKEACMKYIYTYSFLNSITMLKKEVGNSDPKNDSNNAAYNKEVLLGITLAKMLREMHGRPVNIYELLPYNAFEVPQRETKAHARGSLIAIELRESFPNLFMNFVENCDDAYRTERIFLMENARKSLEHTGVVVREEDITNLDLVNGFLLSNDFTTNIIVTSGFFNRKQYLAMSASVIFAQEGLNEPLTFMSGSFATKIRHGEGVMRFGKPAAGSKFCYRASVKDCDGVEYDVAEYFDAYTAVIVPNIADVPIFSDGGSTDDTQRKKSFTNAVAASTLNEALSVGNNYIYFLARSISARDPNKHFVFDFTKGKGPVKQRAIDNAESRRDVMSTGWSVRMNTQAPGAYVERNGGEVLGQDTDTIAVYKRKQLDVIQRIRHVLASPGGYISRIDRTSMLIEEASHNRANLSGVGPGATMVMGDVSMAGTLIQQRKTVKKDIRSSTDASRNIHTDNESYDDVVNFLRKIGVMPNA